MTTPTGPALSEVLERQAEALRIKHMTCWALCRTDPCSECVARIADATALRELARLAKAYSDAMSLTQNAGESILECWTRTGEARTVARDNLLRFLRTDPTQTPENK